MVPEQTNQSEIKLNIKDRDKGLTPPQYIHHHKVS